MKTVEKIFKGICYGVMFIALYSVMTYGISTVHSDTATATMLAKCQMESGQFIPDSWCYVNGEFWTLELNLLIMPLLKIVKNQAVLRMMATAVALSISCIAILRFCKEIFKNDAWTIVIPFFLVYVHGMTGGDAVGEYINSAADCILYEGVNVLPIVWILLICKWMIQRNESGYRKKWLYSILTVGLLYMLCMGSIRYLAEITCALIGTEVILFYIENRKENSFCNCKAKIKTFCGNIALVCGASFLGVMQYAYLKRNKMIGAGVSSYMEFPSDLLQCWNNLREGILGIFLDFGYNASAELFSLQGLENMLCAACVVLLVFLFPILQIKKFEEEEKPIQYVITFTCVHNLIILLMMLWCGYTEGRYAITSIYLCMILSARYIWEYCMKKADFRTLAFSVGIIFATIWMCGRILITGKEWKGLYQSNLEIVKELEAHGLHKGYASYWNSYKYDVYSDFELNINALVIEQNKIEIFPWLVDYENYQVSNEHTFLMLNSYEYGINGEYLQGWFGDPVEILELQGYAVYVYDYDIIQNIDESSDIIFN